MNLSSLHTAVRNTLTQGQQAVAGPLNRTERAALRAWQHRLEQGGHTATRVEPPAPTSDWAAAGTLQSADR